MPDLVYQIFKHFHTHISRTQYSLNVQQGMGGFLS